MNKLHFAPLGAALLGLFASFTAAAQTPAPADTARLYKHHLGLTASPVLDHFFTANRSLPVGLLYKRQTRLNALWRFGLVLNQDYSRRDENNPPPLPFVKSNAEYTYNSWGVSISVGRELTRRFSSHWIGTIGADLNLGFSKYTHKYSSQGAGDSSMGIPPSEKRDESRNRYYQTSLTPFIGLRYNLWPSLYMSAESAISLSYLREATDGRASGIDLSTGRVLYEKDFGPQLIVDQTWTLRYKLISQLSVHYLFSRNE